MSIQPKNAPLYQGLSILLLSLVCTGPAWSSSPSALLNHNSAHSCKALPDAVICFGANKVSKSESQKSSNFSFRSGHDSDRPVITTYLIGLDPAAPILSSDLDALKNRIQQHTAPQEQSIVDSTEKSHPSSHQDQPKKARHKRLRKQVRSSFNVQAIGTATLGSVSITKAFEAPPHKNNWFPPLAFAFALSGVATYYLRQRPIRGIGPTHTSLPHIPQPALLPAPEEDSDRKLIHAAAEIYWNNQLYQGRATEIGSQSIRVEVDDVIRGLKILMPAGLVIRQDDTEPARRLLVQVVSIQPLATEGNHRSVLELRFPQRWQQQQNHKVKHLMKALH